MRYLSRLPGRYGKTARGKTGYFIFFAFFAAAAFRPKICNCLLLATNTSPLATTGIRFEFPLMFCQFPASALNNVAIVARNR